MKETGPKYGIPLETLFKSATKEGIIIIIIMKRLIYCGNY
jgi:hypothetical protein